MESRGALGATGYAVLTRGLRASARIVIVFLLARFYSESEVAAFAYTFVASSLIALVCDLGLSDFAIREIAVSTTSHALERAVLVLRLTTLPISIIASVAIVVATSTTPPLVSLAIVGYANALSIADLLGAIHRGHQRYAHDTLEAAAPVLALVAATGCAAGGAPVEWFFASLGGVGAIVVAVRVVVAARRARDRTTAPVSIISLARSGRWFAVRAVVTTALFELSIILLQQLSSHDEVALFAVAQRPVGLMTQALSVIAMVFLPTLSRTFAGEPDRFKAMTADVNLLYLMLVPAAFGACMLGGQLFLAASGAAYTHNVELVRMLSIAVLAYHGTLTTAPLLAAHRERIVVVSSVTGVIALTVAGLATIPRFGTTGAAIATGIAMVVAKLVQMLGYRLASLPLGDVRHIFALAAAICFIAATIVTNGAMNLVVIVAGVLISTAVSARRLARMRLAR